MAHRGGLARIFAAVVLLAVAGAVALARAARPRQRPPAAPVPDELDRPDPGEGDTQPPSAPTMPSSSQLR